MRTGLTLPRFPSLPQGTPARPAAGGWPPKFGTRSTAADTVSIRFGNTPSVPAPADAETGFLLPSQAPLVVLVQPPTPPWIEELRARLGESVSVTVNVMPVPLELPGRFVTFPRKYYRALAKDIEALAEAFDQLVQNVRSSRRDENPYNLTDAQEDQIVGARDRVAAIRETAAPAIEQVLNTTEPLTTEEQRLLEAQQLAAVEQFNEKIGGVYEEIAWRQSEQQAIAFFQNMVAPPWERVMSTEARLRQMLTESTQAALEAIPEAEIRSAMNARGIPEDWTVVPFDTLLATGLAEGW